MNSTLKIIFTLNRQHYGMWCTQFLRKPVNSIVLQERWKSVERIDRKWRYDINITSRRNQTSSRLTVCWNCSHENKGSGYMFCDKCGSLQNPSSQINYFQLLNFPESFELDKQLLTDKFRQMQRLIHPDKFHNKTPNEQHNSAEWSSLINRAYKTLSNPLDRAQYLLKLLGKASTKSIVQNVEWLQYVMERNEQIENTTDESNLTTLYNEIQSDIAKKVSELEKSFDAKKLDEAEAIVVQLKYLTSIERNIQKKIETSTMQ